MDGDTQLKRPARPDRGSRAIAQGMPSPLPDPASRSLACLHPDCPDLLPVAAFEASPQAIAITNAPPGRQIVFANRAFCRLTGYELHEAIGQRFSLLASPRSEPDAQEEMRRAVMEGRPTTVEITCRRKDGSDYRIRTHVCPVVNRQGGISHWISFQKDITAEDEARHRLEQITDRLETTIAATGDGVWDWDIQSGRLYWSDRFLSLLGLSEEDFNPRIESFLHHVHPADRTRVMEAMRAHLTQADPFETSFRMLHREGQIVEVTCKGRATRSQDGTPLRMAGTVSDVSDLAQSNRHLLRTEAMARIGHWSVKLPGTVMTWSPEVYRIFGVDEEDFVPTLDAIVLSFHPDDRDRIAAQLGAGHSFADDARIALPDGTVRHVHVSGDGMRDPDGRLISLFGVIQDTTRRVEQEERLQVARKMEAFGQMAGGVAHDFNNLLAVIMGNLELLKETPLDGDLAEQLIADALRAVARGRDLTGSLLNFTHKAVLQPRRVDLPRAMAELRRIVTPSLPANIRLDLRCDPAAQFLHVDPGGLEACLISLIMNSRDAMPLGGQIVLRTQRITALGGDPRLYTTQTGTMLRPGSYVVLSVEDEGHGIAEGDLKRVFEPFFTTKGVGKGSGLGLSRVTGFAQQSGGTLRVESVPGAGTEVSLVLPAA